MATSVSKRTAAEPVNPKFMRLSDFLTTSALSYTTYRRLRLEGRTPKEHKISSKTILIRVSDATRWMANPAKRQRKTQATE